MRDSQFSGKIARNQEGIKNMKYLLGLCSCKTYNSFLFKIWLKFIMSFFMKSAKCILKYFFLSCVFISANFFNYRFYSFLYLFVFFLFIFFCTYYSLSKFFFIKGCFWSNAICCVTFYLSISPSYFFFCNTWTQMTRTCYPWSWPALVPRSWADKLHPLPHRTQYWHEGRVLIWTCFMFYWYLPDFVYHFSLVLILERKVPNKQTPWKIKFCGTTTLVCVLPMSI